MKIILINTSESVGGAAVACKRLMKALQKEGVEVKLLVRDKSSQDPDIISTNTSWVASRINFIRFAWERFVIFCHNRLSRKNLFTVSIANTGTDLSKHKAVGDADVIHLHWVNQGMLSLKDIQKLIDLGKPIVWTMHDLWPVTGICHYPGLCENYAEACGTCPMLTNPSSSDLSSKVFIQKKHFFYTSKVQFVGCSRWICNQAQKSALFPNAQFTSIPNSIDTEQFKPQDRMAYRVKFGLPTNKKLVLFGAAKVGDPRKGVELLKLACQLLDAETKKEIEFVFFGKMDPQFIERFPATAHSVGYIEGEDQMIALYNVADLFVTPSLEDNLPNTVMEAMACGVPCVGFDTGGIPEMIDHHKNGYIARYKDADDLAVGIQWCLSDLNSPHLSISARNKVVHNYTESIVAQQYKKLYSMLLAE